MIPSRAIHIATNGRILFFFFWLSSIPLCICTTFSLAIHLSIHLNSFHILATVNNAAMNPSGCRYLFELVFSFSLDKYPRVEVLDCMVVLFLLFLRQSISVSERYLEVQSSPPHLWSCCPWFQLPAVNRSKKILNGKFQK